MLRWSCRLPHLHRLSPAQVLTETDVTSVTQDVLTAYRLSIKMSIVYKTFKTFYSSANCLHKKVENRRMRYNGWMYYSNVFVEEAAAISCPEALQKVATLQYDKGQGLCDNQNSKITSCASNKKLQLTFGECTVDREYTNERMY